MSDEQPVTRMPTFQKIAFLMYLVFFTGFFLYMIRGFLMPIFLAAIFTGLTYPLYEWILEKTRGRPFLSSSLTLLLLNLCLFLPVLTVLIIAISQAVDFLQTLSLEEIRATIFGFLAKMQARFPGLMERFNPAEIASQALTYAQNFLSVAVSSGAAISLSAVNLLVAYGLMVFSMFYFYLDGPRILRRLIRWSPIQDRYEETLLLRFVSVTKGTLKGIMVIGAVQGLIGGVMFLALPDVCCAFLLGVLMAFSSIVPVVGVGLVWVPILLYLLIKGAFAQALVVLLVSTLIIGSVDNILRPVLVGRDIKMHDLLVLFSTLGGITMFGLPGFILGPIVASMAVSIWHMYEQTFQQEIAYNQRRDATNPAKD